MVADALAQADEAEDKRIRTGSKSAVLGSDCVVNVRKADAALRPALCLQGTGAQATSSVAHKCCAIKSSAGTQCVLNLTDVQGSNVEIHSGALVESERSCEPLGDVENRRHPLGGRRQTPLALEVHLFCIPAFGFVP